jgi:hypothetical protein
VLAKDQTIKNDKKGIGCMKLFSREMFHVFNTQKIAL